MPTIDIRDASGEVIYQEITHWQKVAYYICTGRGIPDEQAYKLALRATSEQELQQLLRQLEKDQAKVELQMSA